MYFKMRSILFIFLLIHLSQSFFLPSLHQICDFFTGKGIFKYIWNSRDSKFTTGILITKAGYHPEVHTVVTDDGYVLTLTRIRTLKEPGPPVLIIPGATVASDAYLQDSDSLAFTLAESGFDCWLGDLRGHVFSRSHKYLNPDEGPMFWDFSFHETGIHDIPTFMFKVLNHTKYPKMFYIGHSMGTALFTIMASVKPELNRYIQSAVLLSPSIFPPAYLRSTIFKMLVDNNELIKNVLKIANKNELFERTFGIQAVIRKFCRFPLKVICTSIAHDLSGGNIGSRNNGKFADYIISMNLGGTSTKTILHYLQLFKTDEFKQYDYGEDINYQVYGQKHPPFYPLNQISAPVVIFYSEADHFTDGRSAWKLAQLLSNVVYIEEIPDYSHSDFLFAETAPQLLFRQIVDRFNNESKWNF